MEIPVRTFLQSSHKIVVSEKKKGGENDVGMSSRHAVRYPSPKGTSYFAAIRLFLRIQRQVHATPEGCSYLLQTKGACKPIADLLKENDIPFLSLRNVRDAQ